MRTTSVIKFEFDMYDARKFELLLNEIVEKFNLDQLGADIADKAVKSHLNYMCCYLVSRKLGKRDDALKFGCGLFSGQTTAYVDVLTTIVYPRVDIADAIYHVAHYFDESVTLQVRDTLRIWKED